MICGYLHPEEIFDQVAENPVPPAGAKSIIFNDFLPPEGGRQLVFKAFSTILEGLPIEEKVEGRAMRPKPKETLYP